jgi:hypothetical protein
MNAKEKVEALIIKSFQELNTIGREFGHKLPKNGSRLIFPQYMKREKGKTRVSEQEARFLFVKQLEEDKECPFYYSIEAPTKEKYKFSEKRENKNREKKSPIIINTGRSANIDVCLYNSNFKRTNLIEFKSGNPKQHDYSKDFLKLLCDEQNLTNYFVHIVDVDDLSKRNTVSNIKKKYSDAINNFEQATSNLIIFLFNITGKVIHKYCIENKTLKQMDDILINSDK